MALLFAIQSWTQRHIDRHSLVGTDIKCQWDHQRLESKPEEIDMLDFRMDQSTPLIEPTVSTYKPDTKHPGLSDREVEINLFRLCAGSSALFTQTLNPPDDLSHLAEPPPPPQTVSQMLNNYCSDESDVLEWLRESTSQKDVELIENLTFGQSENEDWFHYRQGRITASAFHEVLHAKPSNIDKLAEKLVSPHQEIHAAPLQHGKMYEPVARQLYRNKYRKLHIASKITECGLVVNSQCPELGASPDGLVKCKCCGEGLLEIKCSYKYRFVTPKEVCSDVKYHCVIDSEGQFKLKPQSPWYCQIQGQLGVCNRKWCDFVLFTLKGIEQDRIYFDAEYWNVMKEKLSDIFGSYVAPKLIKHKKSRT